MSAYQGTLESIRNTVLSDLRLDETLDSDRVDQEINLAYSQVVQETGALQKAGTASLTAGDGSFALPDPVAWVRALVLVYPDGSVSDPAQELSLEEILSLRRASTTVSQNYSLPAFAVIGQNRCELWPDVPAGGATAHFYYVYLPDLLSDDDDEPLLMEPYGSKLLAAGASVAMCMFKKDPALPIFQADYDRWMANYQRWLNRRRSSNHGSIRVELTSRHPDYAYARDVG